MGIETAIAVAAVASAVVSVGTGIYSTVQQGKARDEQKKARALEQQKMQAQERRRRRQEIRQKRIAAAETINTAVALGAGNSSGPAGGLTSLSSQLGSSQGFASHISGLNTGISNHLQRAENHIGRANTVSSVGGAVSGALGAVGSVGGFFSGTSGQNFKPGTNLLGYSGGVY